ncbi:hypothetical protein NA57DRAFT_60948 [Rhizodiscina lignyota]|uniref:Uncharacterized protein n=1 Tax=Rhizodiscina lignyota TaxID=1504668 RepID=A0A9P4M260_9PEZI|nr:hypothetical protein NA57DRAFT_60948 [Rhizodiscina lignyota]
MLGKLSFALSALSLTAVSALNTLPNVTAVAVNDCSAYPDYNPSMGSATGWLYWVNQSNSPAEGNGDSVQIVYESGVQGVQIVRMTVTDDNQIAKYPMRCTPTSSNPAQIEAYIPCGVSGYCWNPLNIAPYPYDAELMWGVDGPAVQAYQHFIGGVQQPGLFLGSQGVTKWGIERVAQGGAPTGQPYWTLRLLGPNSQVPPGSPNATATYADEYETFILIQ